MKLKRSYHEGSRIYTMDSVCFYIYDKASSQLINMMSVRQGTRLYPDIVYTLLYGDRIETADEESLRIAMETKLNLDKD